MPTPDPHPKGRVPAPLAPHEQELLNVVKLAHNNLLLARKTKAGELDRRIAEARIQAAREWDQIEATIRIDLEAEIARHEAAEDEALIAAYNAGIPVRRIALDGFGNRLDGNVHAKLRDLRSDGRVGNATEYQAAGRGNAETDERVVEFPKAVDADAILAEVTTISEPLFSLNADLLVLVEPAPDGSDPGIAVPAVTLSMDARDPYFRSIEANARKGTPFLRATTATLYVHPNTGELIVHESKETGDLYWDHPVARWVKDHREEAQRGYAAATLSAE